MVETRICNTCGEEKCITEFPKNGVDKEGIQQRRPDCNVCYKIKRKLGKKQFNKFKSNTKSRTSETEVITLEQWKAALVVFKGACAYCGHETTKRGERLTKEHVVPVSKGGTSGKDNIIPACARCNHSKGNTDLEEWYPKQKFYSTERLQLIRRWLNE